MKNLLMSQKWVRLIVPLFAIAIVFAACSKNDGPDQNIPTAGFMAFNLATDQPAVGYTLSGGQLTNVPLSYGAYTGNYLPIYVGPREVRTFDFNNGSTLATSNEVFQDSSYYSAFLVGYNGAYRNVVVEDSYENVVPVTGKAWVRYINAVADSTAVPSVTVGDNTHTAAYGTVSAFTQVNTGDLTISISNGSNISATRTIAVEQDKIYTVLLTGKPGQSDPNLAVQIKFIINGTAN